MWEFWEFVFSVWNPSGLQTLGNKRWGDGTINGKQDSRICLDRLDLEPNLSWSPWPLDFPAVFTCKFPLPFNSISLSFLFLFQFFFFLLFMILYLLIMLSRHNVCLLNSFPIILSCPNACEELVSFACWGKKMSPPPPNINDQQFLREGWSLVSPNLCPLHSIDVEPV